MKSIFIDNEKTPTASDLRNALGGTFEVWQALADFTQKSYPGAREEWKYSSSKYGWSFRISDKKRILLYLLPRDKFFKVAFVFGQKTTDEILASSLPASIKTELKGAKVYAEGRGIRIDIRDSSMLKDLEKLIEIKISC